MTAHVHGLSSMGDIAAIHGELERVATWWSGNGNDHLAMEQLKELAGDFHVRHRAAQLGDVHDTAASIERARSELEFDPGWDLRRGLTEQIEVACPTGVGRHHGLNWPLCALTATQLGQLAAPVAGPCRLK